MATSPRNTLQVEELMNDLYLKTSGYGNHDNRIKGVKVTPTPIKFRFLGLDCELFVRYPDYTERAKKSRAYVFVDGESILENLNNRVNRPKTIYKEILKAGLAEAGISEEVYEKVTWSQYAGCSCPCSPGFIVNGIARWDIAVKVVERNEQLLKEDPNMPARI